MKMKRERAIEVLGVNSNATEGEIRKAYLKLSRKYHPDKGGDVKQFQELSNAYESLKAPEPSSEVSADDVFADAFADLRNASEQRANKAVSKFVAFLAPLQASGLLSPEEVRVNVVGIRNNEKRDQINWVVEALQTAGLLTGKMAHVNINTVVNHHYVTGIQTALQAMQKNQILLTQDNFSKVVNHPQHEDIGDAITRLAEECLMTTPEMAQANFDAVVSEQHLKIGVHNIIEKSKALPVQDHIKSSLYTQQAVDPKLDEFHASRIFFYFYNKAVKAEGVLGNMFKSRLKPDVRISEIILNAMNGKDATAKQVVTNLGWFDKNGAITEQAPECIHTSIQLNEMRAEYNNKRAAPK